MVIWITDPSLYNQTIYICLTALPTTINGDYSDITYT